MEKEKSRKRARRQKQGRSSSGTRQKNRSTHAPGAAPAPAAASPVPTSAKEYTVDDLARAAIPLLDAGGQQALLNLLAQFGVQGIPQLSKDQYGAFATALRGLGAKI